MIKDMKKGLDLKAYNDFVPRLQVKNFRDLEFVLRNKCIAPVTIVDNKIIWQTWLDDYLFSEECIYKGFRVLDPFVVTDINTGLEYLANWEYHITIIENCYYLKLEIL